MLYTTTAQFPHAHSARAASFLRGLGLSNTVADAALKLDWSAILNGTNQEEAKPLDTGTI